LACAQVRPAFCFVFAGFSASAINTRINDSDCKMVITSDGGYGNKTIDLKKGIIDDALSTLCC
jgi:acetyl-CoA synthetase